MRKGFKERGAFEQSPAGGEGGEPEGLREVFQAEGQELGSAQPLQPLRPAGKRRCLSPLPPDALSLAQGNLGHWEESGVPARVLPSAPLELSTVSTIVHRLQTAFREALDLYNVVSQDPGSGEKAR